MERTQLKTTELGATGLEITRVGFGAWAIGGGGWEWGWGPQDDDESVAAIHRALELGVNWIDTAAAYGFGHSEQVVGRALGGLDERPYVFTKAALLEGPGRTHGPEPAARLAPARGRGEPRSGSASTRSTSTRSTGRSRTRTSRRAGRRWPSCKDEGLVRHIGVSNFNVEQLRRIQAIAPVETLQPPYSLVAREVEDEILPFAEREGIGVIVYSPMGSGLLTGAMTRERIERLPDDDWRKRDPRFQEPQLSQHLALVERLETVAERHDIDARRGRGRLDAAQPGRRRRDRRLPPARPGRPDRRRGEPRARPKTTSRRSKGGDDMATTTTIGFVGLGHMGGNMAARLLAAGYDRLWRVARDREQRAASSSTRGCAGATRRARSPKPPTSSSPRFPTTACSKGSRRGPDGISGRPGARARSGST